MAIPWSSLAKLSIESLPMVCCRPWPRKACSPHRDPGSAGSHPGRGQRLQGQCQPRGQPGFPVAELRPLQLRVHPTAWGCGIFIMEIQPWRSRFRGWTDPEKAHRPHAGLDFRSVHLPDAALLEHLWSLVGAPPADTTVGKTPTGGGGDQAKGRQSGGCPGTGWGGWDGGCTVTATITSAVPSLFREGTLALSPPFSACTVNSQITKLFPNC